MNRLICWMFGHNWFKTERKGVELRCCLRCRKNNHKSFSDEVFSEYKMEYAEMPVKYQKIFDE